MSTDHPAADSAEPTVSPPARSRPAAPWRAAVSVVLATIGLFAVGLTPAAIPILYLAAVTPALVLADLAERRLPNRLVLPGYPICLAAVVLQWTTSGQLPVVPLVSGALYFGFLLVLSIAGGMGMGDVKLAGVLGVSAGFAGSGAALVSPLLAFTVGGLWSVALLVRGRRGRIPFGPFLLAGYWIAIVLYPVAPIA